MKLHSPFIITARLLPGVQVGDGFISIEYAGNGSDGRSGDAERITITINESANR